VTAEWSELGLKSGLTGSTMEPAGAAKVTGGAVCDDGAGTCADAIGAVLMAGIAAGAGRSFCPVPLLTAGSIPSAATRAGSGRD